MSLDFPSLDHESVLDVVKFTSTVAAPEASLPHFHADSLLPLLACPQYAFSNIRHSTPADPHALPSAQYPGHVLYT